MPQAAWRPFSNTRPRSPNCCATPGGLADHLVLAGPAKVDALYGSDPKAATLLKQGIREDLSLTGAPVLIDCCPMLGVLTLMRCWRPTAC